MAQSARKLTPVDDNDKDKDAGEAAPPQSAAEVEAVKGEVISGDEARTIEWEGITFAIPKEMPAVAILDRAEMESSNDSGAIIRLLRTILGPDQFMQARNRVVEVSKPDMSDQIEHITALISAVMEAYGTSEGESPASEG